MSAMQKFKGAALALLWLLTIALVVVWDQNLLSIAASGLGVAATLLLLFGLRWWRAAGAVASALFVVNWALALVMIDNGGSPLDTYRSVLRGAMQSSAIFDSAVVLAYEAALPLLHLITSLALCVGLLRRKRME